MINNMIARRYAKALVQLGTEGGLVDRFREELSGVDQVFTGNPDLREAFNNPAFTSEQKKGIMKGVIEKINCSEMVSNFLLLLVDKNRVVFLGQIAQAYEKLADEQSGILRPDIRTALALDAAQVDLIQAALEKKTGKKIIPQLSVDNNLLGGIVTQIGDTAFDSSVKTQLKRIQDILQKG